jgi:carbon monoxide dehydrogenase subunit G
VEISGVVTRSARARAGAESVFALLADVPRSIAHFPDVESVEPRGDAWYWRLRELGAGPLRFQVVYASRYHVDAAARRVWWEAIPGVGNARIEGRWRIEPDGAETSITMDARYSLETPFPRLTRAAVEAVVAREQARLVDLYLANLVRTLEGGDGRASRERGRA